MFKFRHAGFVKNVLVLLLGVGFLFIPLAQVHAAPVVITSPKTILVSTFQDETTTQDCRYAKVQGTIDDARKHAGPCPPGTVAKIVNISEKQAQEQGLDYVVIPLQPHTDIAAWQNYAVQVEALQDKGLAKWQSTMSHSAQVTAQSCGGSSTIYTNYYESIDGNIYWSVEAAISYNYASDCQHITFTQRWMELDIDTYGAGLMWYGSFGISASAYASTYWNPCAVTYSAGGSFTYNMNSYQHSGYYFVDHFDGASDTGCVLYTEPPDLTIDLGPI